MVTWPTFEIDPGSAVDRTNTILCLLLWIIAVYYAFTQVMPRALYATGLFGLAFIIYILDESANSLREHDYLDVALLASVGIIVIIATVYLILEFETLLFWRTGTALHHEYFMAFMFSAAMFYLIYRAYGMAFLAVIAGGTFYAWRGDLIPGIAGHSGLSLTRILNVYALEFEGFYGSISGIVAAWVALFLLYAGLLQGYGAFDYIMRLAFRAVDYIRSGVAQSAVVASLIIGSINGAQTANAAMTGSVTIPLMKDSGLKASTAAAIESVASSGGQIMPPVMGAAAFIMASLLGITYAEVLIAGIVPAFVFYISVAIAVHYTALNEEIGSVDVDYGEKFSNEERMSRIEFLSETVKLGIPFLLLIYLLGIVQWTVMSSALWTCIAMLVTGITFPILENHVFGWRDMSIGETVIGVLQDTLRGLRYGAIVFAPIAIIVAAINAIVDVLVTTGVPGSLALALMDLSGGFLLVALLLAMLVCIILGLGMPTVAAYTIVALLVAPGLVESFALPSLAVHYFVFYAAILSGITPPIAIAVVVATGIAQSNFWFTAFKALKISAPLFVLPFAFIYNPEIVLGGFTLFSIASSGILLIGALAMVHGLNYHQIAFNRRPIDFGYRLIIVATGIVIMAAPGMTVRTGAIMVAAVLVAVQMSLVWDVGVRDIPMAVKNRR